MMRIITGKAKGVKLATLPGDATRPTSERVKEAIFSSLQFDLEGRRALDLFAGSGQLGLEALSRGVVSCTFIDSAPEAIAVVKENAKKTGFFSDCKYLISDYRSYLRKAGKGEGFTLIFIDPPYALDAVADAVSRILAAKVAKPGCLLVCESGSPDLMTKLGDAADKFDVQKEARYGITYITLLRYRGEADEEGEKA